MAGANSLPRRGRNLDLRGIRAARGVLQAADGLFALAEEFLQLEEVRGSAAQGFAEGARGGAAEGATLAGRRQPGDSGFRIDMDSGQ
jgi:hypothetical protein